MMEDVLVRAKEIVPVGIPEPEPVELLLSFGDILEYRHRPLTEITCEGDGYRRFMHDPRYKPTLILKRSGTQYSVSHVNTGGDWDVIK